MGDGGSLVIGFALAVLIARTTFYNPAEQGTGIARGWYGIFMPLAILAVPLYDLFTVSLLRLKQGRSPLVGDQQHYSHRLVTRSFIPRCGRCHLVHCRGHGYVRCFPGSSRTMAGYSRGCADSAHSCHARRARTCQSACFR